MPEHGTREGSKFFCGYWMDIEEWDDVHDYSPPVAVTEARPEALSKLPTRNGAEQNSYDPDASAQSRNLSELEDEPSF